MRCAEDGATGLTFQQSLASGQMQQRTSFEPAKVTVRVA
jgi:hypothetical protein